MAHKLYYQGKATAARRNQRPLRRERDLTYSHFGFYAAAKIHS
ncbi:MAG: hypothetical protein E7E95_04530 [Prevotella bivia]|uniref:Uncharacterized protein n=1 Tax=Prevotella bivia TaxID=28125 RepID=A0A137SU78_9BACT|nr:hypothetical protein [Prevotella bivia]KXO15907.1 hypothetical protein HMPREF3202_01549 [Prevotella bivia]KXU55970.1 hypothetical protein HMPREF3218_0202179 [Prevotella bivia]MDU2113700.1 hypothetical protein [Prevotella bivia]MDU2329663.1 hypothetical protein [Prevotella bivia]MDU5343350.1 hypothetical protein [Prevotella bivia]